MSQFHFLHPAWLLALIPLGLLLWFSFKNHASGSAWEKVIDPNLLSILLQGEDKNTGNLVKWLLGFGWLIATFALADPTWEKVSKPVFQTNTARVLVLDLSNSMLINDLKPSRLARARFKVEDILSSQFLKNEEGQTGLVVFAGDAFTVSPLTRDVATIRSLLKVLTPRLLPVQGSRVDLGLKKAHELLKQAGVQNGSVLLIADGITDNNLAVSEAKSLRKASHQLSVLGVGTDAGGQLRTGQGLKITVKLEGDALQALAQAGGGSYHRISNNNADLNQLLKQSSRKTGEIEKSTDLVDDILSTDLNNEEWKSLGPYLIFLLLPLAALAFRKGWLLSVVAGVFIISIMVQPQTAMAFSFDEQWQALWKNKEQRAHDALLKKQYEKASQLTKSPLRRGIAEYKKESFETAVKSFKAEQGADARFNEGNALARLKKYPEAMAAYDEALKEQPDMADAKANKKTIEDFLKQQKKNKDNKQNKKDGKKQGDKKQGDKADQNSKKNQQQEKNQQDKNKNAESKKESDKKDNQFSNANKKLADKKKNKDQEKTKKDQQDNKDPANKKLSKEQQQKANQKSQKEKEQQKAELARANAQAKDLNKE
jgi:Ca-activated chloride channel family protein